MDECAINYGILRFRDPDVESPSTGETKYYGSSEEETCGVTEHHSNLESEDTELLLSLEPGTVSPTNQTNARQEIKTRNRFLKRELFKKKILSQIYHSKIY